MFNYYAISFVLHWGAISTYHKWLNRFFGKPRCDSFWFNWLAHGLFIGLAAIPLAWTGISWWLILIRAIVLGVTTMIWSEIISSDVWEEMGRGFLIAATLLFFKL